MSKFSTIYDAVVTETSSLFASKSRLHNPYELLENPEIVRKNAWGLRVETGQNTSQEFCQLTIERTFTMVLVRQFVSLAGKEDGFDSVTKELVEAQQSFIQLIYSPTELMRQNEIDIINIQNVSGIEQLIDGEKKFLFCEVTFTITISELIS
jgi:uncharacterized protein (DUF1015 family)